ATGVNGGTVNINLSSVSSDFTVGNAAGNVQLQAGTAFSAMRPLIGSSGSVNLSVGHNLTVNTNAMTLDSTATSSVTGANITLSAGSSFFPANLKIVGGNLSANGL